MTNAAGKKSETALYRPYGEQSEQVWTALLNETRGYIGERYDADAGLQYLNARYYDPRLGMFLQPDWWEVMQAGVGTNRYSYSFNDPVNGKDVTGHEVVRNRTGNVHQLKDYLDKSKSKVGKKTGAEAEQALKKFGKNSGLSGGYTPSDNYLIGGAPNKYVTRYVYTKTAGWVDMYHFMHYAGVAYTEKTTPTYGPKGRASPTSADIAVNRALSRGYLQESIFDKLSRKGISRYSYEDLPSDCYGADFGARHFDPKFSDALSEQVGKYLDRLGATSPAEAPNFKELPASDEASASRYDSWLGGGKVGPDPIPRNYDVTPMFNY